MTPELVPEGWHRARRHDGEVQPVPEDRPDGVQEVASRLGGPSSRLDRLRPPPAQDGRRDLIEAPIPEQGEDRTPRPQAEPALLLRGPREVTHVLGEVALGEVAEAGNLPGVEGHPAHSGSVLVEASDLRRRTPIVRAAGEPDPPAADDPLVVDDVSARDEVLVLRSLGSRPHFLSPCFR